MLVLGSRLLSMPVMSLQTGTKLAETNLPIIDPSNLKIMAYQIDGPLLGGRPSLLLISDVREIGKLGMIIDSSDEFVEPGDVIAIKKISDLNFKLIGMAVIDETKRKLGRVEDFSVDTDSFIIQQLHIKRGLLKSLSETEFLVHRSQIIEINDTQIIVKTTAKKLPIAPHKSKQLSYVNPFRSPAPQTENRE